MYLPNPVLHNIPHPSDWPTSVRHLAPKSYPTDISGLLDFPTFRLTRDIIGELCATRRPDYFLRTPTSFTGGRSIPLRDVFGLVLPAVAFLRHSLEHSDEDGFTNSAGPLLYSLIRALCAIVAGDSLVIEHATYILPYTDDYVHKFQQGVFDGMSSIMISTVVWPKAVTRSTSAADVPMDTSGASMSMTRDMLRQERVRERSFRSSHATGSQPEVDTPAAVSDVLETKRYCLLPIVLVADFENIVPLMTSSLFQRFVWGISDPVVGLAFSKFGTTVQVFLGWLEFREGNPHVHIARAADPGQCSSPCGVFDMTDPWAACSLAEFILGLSSHIDNVATAASNCYFLRTLHWRSDGCDLGDGPSDETEEEFLHKRILSWLGDVEPYSPDGEAITPSDMSRPQSRPQSHPPTINLPGSSVPPLRNNLLSPVAAELQREGSDKQSNKGKSEKTEAVSATNFVNRGVKQLSDATSTICSWLFDRFAIIISNDDLKVKVPLGSILSQDEDELENESAFLFCKYQVSESLDDAVREERAHMIALYDNITGDYWPETWTKTSRPKATSKFKPLYDSLWEQHKLDTSRTYKTLDEGIVPLVESRLDYILSACIETISWNMPEPWRTIYEAERRQPWDRFVQLLYVAEGEDASILLFLEREISLSRNKVEDCLKKKDLTADDISNVLLDCIGLAKDMGQIYTWELSNIGRNMTKQLETLSAFHLSMSFERSLTDLLAQNDTGGFKDRVLKHAKEEPWRGKCDAMLAEPYSFELPELSEGNRKHYELALRRFQIVHRFNNTEGSNSAKSSNASTKDISLDRQSIEKGTWSELAKAFKNPIQLSLQANRRPALPEVEINHKPLPPRPWVMVPRLLVEYKKTESEDKALQQILMYCVSEAQKLAAMGIYGYPVFGLLTNGTTGGVIMAWTSKLTKATYVVVRQMRTYDLMLPLDCYRFAVFLLNLRAYHENNKTMNDKINAKIAAYSVDGWPEWAQRHQHVPSDDVKAMNGLKGETKSTAQG
ncbi:unnamed protein product [Somion occarium]|uniref:Uncharacterized protein n=1 Tax=Somion occarium TaxID=3059160 RepID=A0ABP1DUY0_9APHY